METFELAEISHRREATGERYLQFINQGTLSLGLYALAAGATDEQKPHAEDEVYYVVRGRATVVVAGERRPVTAGSIIFVAKEVAHRFVDIAEDLEILVFFAPQHRG